ncbi:DNA-methyltransferase [Methanoregula sp.]|jgi:site-specific DNA-methyltransferase (adenine-specific)|uniref:DNA-methyltransferase n=1 Tax=Methanoregula sp. TaxID=2052170 RepID=UPI003C70C849
MSSKKNSPRILHDSFFYNEDCITGALNHLDDNSVDLIVTDPPYGINGNNHHLHYNRNEKLVVDGYIEIPGSEYEKFSYEWIREAARVLRPGGSIYVVSGYTNLSYVLRALQDEGLKEINHIIWKFNFGVYTRKKYVSSHYHILFCEKPGGVRTFNVESRFGLKEANENGRSINYFDREDVWTIPRQYKPGKIKNQNELPDELLKKMLQYSSNEGDLVCDFFMGGFSTARVAIGLNRKFVGFELSSSIFQEKIKEIETLEPGYLFSKLRTPIVKKSINQGKSWDPEECQKLLSRYNELLKSGKTKKDVVVILQDEFQRGYWSIEKALKKIIDLQ